MFKCSILEKVQILEKKSCVTAVNRNIFVHALLYAFLHQKPSQAKTAVVTRVRAAG